MTEGAIPFVARDPLRVIPALAVGSALAGAISMLVGAELKVPHGGVFVLTIPEAATHVWGYLAAIAAGTVVSTLLPIEEFKNDQGEIEVQPGDFVSVAIGSIENGYDNTILSRDTAKRLASWMALEQALESGEFVTGTTSGKVKGGLTVLVNGIRAFLPGSLVDTRPTKDLTPYENKTMEFKIIKLAEYWKE